MSIKVAPEVRSNVYTGTNGDMSVALIEYSSDDFKQGDVIVLANLPAGAELLEFMIGSESIPAGVSAHLGVMYQDGTIEFIHPAITIAASVNEKVTLSEPFTLQQNAQFVAKVESSGTTVKPTLTSFTVDLSDNDIPVGDMATASAIDPRPTGASLSTVTWKSSDNKKATIQPNGNINGVAAGVVTITGTDTATSVEATAQITISAGPVTTQSITVNNADVIAAVTFSGDNGSGTATIDADAIDHVTLSLTGTTTGLSNTDNVTAHIVADSGYDISGHGSAFDLQVQVTGLKAPINPGKQYDFHVTLGGSAATPKLGLDHTGSRTQGSIRPDSWAGGSATLALLSVNRSNGAFIIKSSDASKWNGLDSIEVEIEGYANSPLTLSWFSSQSWYSKLQESDLYDYFLQRLASNEVIGVNIKAPVSTN
ncbi:TPA: Ig-like domain-containing protein [Vibrio harveyi]|nr:Ig-like domain-containing protein [Vibrio harveyi]